jgi:hypothetical protein
MAMLDHPTSEGTRHAKVRHLSRWRRKQMTMDGHTIRMIANDLPDEIQHERNRAELLQNTVFFISY